MTRHVLFAFAALLLGFSQPTAAHADLPAGVVYDDSFPFFIAQEHSEMNNNRPTNRYALLSWARLLGENIAPESGWRFVYKQGRRTLATATCDGNRAFRRQNMGNTPHDTFVAARCDTGDDDFLTATGAITVEVYFLNDDDDSETRVATHEIEVLELRQESHDGTQRTSDYSVNLHGFGAVVFLDQVRRNELYAFAGMSGNEMSGGSAGNSQVNLIITRSSGHSPDRSYRFRCSVDGNRIDFGHARMDDGSVGERRTQAIQVLRGGNSTVREQLHWQTDRYRLPIVWGDNTNGARLEDHPGRWECDLRDDERRTIRSFSFQVADGLIQPHPEEAGMNFPERVHLADVTLPGPNDADERTDPSVARSQAFWGRGFQTAEGRAMGGRVAAVGEPYPRSVRRRGNRSRRR
ncbi:MAG: hypothetical protein AAF447_14080 [Myxococcota bacterium]